MQAKTEDAEVGYRIYREKQGRIGLDELNKELDGRGRNPVAGRSYEHFRRMYNYGVPDYMSINTFDQLRKRTPDLVLATEEKHGQMIAHQLRNRIATMSAAVSTLRAQLERGGLDTTDAEEQIAALDHQLKATDAFVDRYLKYAARPEPQLAVAVVVDTVSEAVSRFRGRYPDVEFVVSDESSGMKADIDMALLTAAIENIVQNSCRAMDGRGQLRVTVQKVKSKVELLFQDSGPGIGEENKFKLFDVNYTKWPRGGGTGLGLAMVRKVVADVHRGKVDIRNRKDGETGAEFWMQFPRKQKNAK